MCVFATAVLTGACAGRPPSLEYRTLVVQTIQPERPVASERLEDKADEVVSREKLHPLPSREVLVYSVRWLGFTVGTVTAEIKGETLLNGRPVYVFEIHGQSNVWISKVYNMNSTFTSYMDKESLVSLRQQTDRKEGRYRKDSQTDYDIAAGEAHFHNAVDNSRKTYPIPPKMQDALSVVYYVRMLPIRPGLEVQLPVSVNEKVYDLVIRIGHEKTMPLPDGQRVSTVFVKPVGYLNGQEVTKGTMTGYFSSEPPHIPVYAELRAPMFTKVTVRLEEIQREGSPHGR